MRTYWGINELNLDEVVVDWFLGDDPPERSLRSPWGGPHAGGSRVWSAYDRCGRPKALRPFLGYSDEWEDDPEHRNHNDKPIVKAAQKFLHEPSQF